MGLQANGGKQVLYSLGDFSGGVNSNDPQIAINDNQVANCLNAVFEKKGVKRWCGVENVTAKDACNDYFRGLNHSAEIAGTQHLFTMFGGKLYEVNKTTGALSSALYDATGTGEMWGGTHWGKFYATNGAKVFKVEGSTASQVGITPPASGTSAAAAGGTLPDGVYKIQVAYARKVSGLNVLYSQGYALGNVTLSGGNNTISITGFANSADGQVNNKVVFMTLAGGTTYYYFAETGNNTTTTITITSDTSENAIVAEQFLIPSGLPPALTALICFDNRIFGVKDNCLYYSMKATTSYDLERFPALNKIEYPFQLTGIFSLGTSLYLNTADNGIIMQAVEDLDSRFEHVEKRLSFKFLRTVADWNGGKIGLTKDGLKFFDGTRFFDFDYSINIRSIIMAMYATASANFQPVGFTCSRNNRLEYHLSFRNTTVGSLNNNRTYVLNLSQTIVESNVSYKTPWEILDRGFNYVAVDSGNVAYYGQSFLDSSTIYKELTTHTTQKGIYNGVGTYLAAATDMLCFYTTKIFCKNLFTITKIDEYAALLLLNASTRFSIFIADDPSKLIVQDTDISAYSSAQFDAAVFDVDLFSTESLQKYAEKAALGTFGYSWYATVAQTADDVNFNITNIDLIVTEETGNGI